MSTLQVANIVGVSFFLMNNLVSNSTTSDINMYTGNTSTTNKISVWSNGSGVGVIGNTVITGSANVSGNVNISGNVVITGTANISGPANFTGLTKLNGSTTAAGVVLTNAVENMNVTATSATGTINFDVTSQSIIYYTASASANFILNIRGNVSTRLNTLMANNQSLTIVFMNTNGATAYYNNSFQIDGSTVSVKWTSGVAPSAGNINSVDLYTYTIVKTGTDAYTTFANLTKFA